MRKKKYIKKIDFDDLNAFVERTIKTESSFQNAMKKEGVAEYYKLERLRAIGKLIQRLGKKQYDLLMSDVTYSTLTDEQNNALTELQKAYNKVCSVFPQSPADDAH